MTQFLAASNGVEVSLEDLHYLDEEPPEALAAPQSPEANMANVAMAFGAVRQ